MPGKHSTDHSAMEIWFVLRRASHQGKLRHAEDFSAYVLNTLPPHRQGTRLDIIENTKRNAVNKKG